MNNLIISHHFQLTSPLLNLVHSIAMVPIFHPLSTSVASSTTPSTPNSHLVNSTFHTPNLSLNYYHQQLHTQLTPILPSFHLSFQQYQQPQQIHNTNNNNILFSSLSNTRLKSLPNLPNDIWHSIASLLPPNTLANFAQTCTTNAQVTRTILHQSIMNSLFNINHSKPDHIQANAITKTVTLLDSSPSLRSKRLSQQLINISQSKIYQLHSIDITECFTIDQAIAFLNIDKQKLVKYSPAPITRRRGIRKRRNSTKRLISTSLNSFNAFRPLPPDANPNSCIKNPVYTLDTVLKAAMDTHGNMSTCLNHVKKNVNQDWNRFERSKLAEENVINLAKQFNLKRFEIEHILDASPDVVDYRMGLLKKSTQEYSQMIKDLLTVYANLDNIYKFLLLKDGNARLKSKRLVGKALRNMKPFNHSKVTQSLQSNLWWAKSPSNKKKMEEMSYGIPQLEL